MSPRPVTRGESTPNAVKVDWLNATFPAPVLSPEGFVSLLSRMLHRPVSGVQSRGLLGFERSIALYARHGSLTSHIGALAFGGDGQAGRWLFQLTGTGCQFVRDWVALSDFLESLDARLTRVDLALDFLDGRHSVDDAVSLYKAGAFTSSGRPPSSSLAGDWLGRSDGRTFYVGKAKNGKMLRVYEKGRQLGDASSDWVRFEVQLGNRDRVLPFRVLTDSDAFFAGCYPALASFVEDASETIPTLSKSGEITIAHLLHHLKRCYGKVLGTLQDSTAVTDAELVEECRIIGLPRRVPLSSLAAGITWADVQAQVKTISTS
jgi:phage replication initiation protein